MPRLPTVVGVDLAASAPNTAVAVLDGMSVIDLVVGANDAAILRLSRNAVKDRHRLPARLAGALRRLRRRTATRQQRPLHGIDRRPLVYRATDMYCQRRGMRPLSVSADRIGHAAMRCAGLLRQLGETDRSGTARVVEACPAGSLRIWGLRHAGYKRGDGLADLADAVITRAGLEFVDDHIRELCHCVDHAFDAVVAALTARAVALGHVEPIPDEFSELARVEGWIALPSVPLEDI